MNKTWKPLVLVLGLSALFFAVFLAASFSFLSRGGGEERVAGLPLGKDAVAVIELNGVITDSKRFLKSLKELEERKSVKALVVRINSPGGAVAPSQEIYEAVKRFPKPVVASMSSVAASGGYYVALAAKKVYANPGTITGSIGVIMEFANMEKLYDWAKIKRYSIKTGKFKDAGAEYREMTVDERALLQGMVDDVLVQFRQAVAEGRKLTMEQVIAVSDGRIFSGSQAKTEKLVDELGTLDDAVDAAGKLGGISGKPRVFVHEKKKKFWEEMLEEAGGHSDEDSESSSSRSPIASVATTLLARALDLPATESLKPGVYWLWKGAL